MARARATAAAGGRTATRSAGGQRGVFVQTPKSDIFVALLGVAVGAMVLGVLLLLLVLTRYGFSTKVTSTFGGSNPAATVASSGTIEKIATVRL